MISDDTEYDGPGKMDAGTLLMQTESSMKLNTNSNNSEETPTETDALGIGDSNGFFSKRKTDRSAMITHYNMERVHRGHAVIVNNENFHWSTGMNKRTGTDIDADNLKRIFRKLGFCVSMYKDTTCIQLHEIVDNFAKEDHTDRDCFLFAILSHGDNGTIYGTDGIIPIKLLVDKFRGDKCQTLAGKPKIFMFQACRGTDYEIPVEPASDTVDAPSDADPHMLVVDSGPCPTVPSGSDFLFCYSVAEGFYSFRDTLFGSWYVQEFTDVMETLIFKAADGSKDLPDFVDILTEVNHKVSNRQVVNSASANARGKKQMPCFLSMLTKKLYLLPKIKVRKGSKRLTGTTSQV